MNDVVDLLDQTLTEEKETDEKLSQIGEQIANASAGEGDGDEEGQEDEDEEASPRKSAPARKKSAKAA